jgi:hypothetical protein
MRLETVQADNGGSPVRCCLRETRPGERVMLIAYTPPGTAGAYAERGLWVPRTLSTSCDQAVFVDHATDASVPSDTVLLKINRFG